METEILAQAAPQDTAAPEGPFTAPAPQPEAVEAPSEPAQEVGPEKKWWQEAESEDDLLAHETIAPRLEERETQGYSRGVLDGKVSALEVLDTRSNDVSQAKNVAQALIGRLNKAARDGQLDADAVDNLLTDHQQSIAGLNRIIGDELKDEGRVDGYRTFVREVANHLSDQQLETEFTNRIALALRGVKDDKLVADFVTRITQKAEKAARDKGFGEGRAAEAKAQAEKAKVETRATEGPNTAPSQAGGGRRPTVAEYSAATSEQRKKWRDEGVEVQI